MITNKDLMIQNESYTKKDFYQIYPEILDLVKQITNRWDPSSSNESDPGVVLLKLLAFIADKTNYNIDKNILECFMPSVTQNENMRKLCDMMGYDMHYYKSAFTTISVMWKGDELANPSEVIPTKEITIPRFTVVSDDSKDINFVTTKETKLIYRYEVKDIDVIEGQLVDFKVNDDDYISIFNLDSRNRLYFPESQIAENGIWVYQPDLNSGIDYVTDTNTWEQVTNLNTQNINYKVYKFGYDSSKNLPYLQFPENVTEFFGKGIKVKYIRTKGAEGNISAKTLTTLSEGKVKLLDTSSGNLSEISIRDDEGEYLVIENASATTNGYDLETLDEAYEGFKRTVGTFDTLVTCRDYANKIYDMIQSTRDNTHLVSNCQVADIRDDINTSQTIVTLNEYGTVFEKEVAQEVVNVNRVDGDKGVVQINKDRVSNFDLFIYPLNPINNSYSQETYRNSFKPNYDNIYNIKSQLEDYKTLNHNIKQFNTKSEYNDIYLIKNYYNLSAKISTTSKVSNYEANQIKNNIYKNLFKKFNARQLEYGEEIPFDQILECIQESDSRIKNVSLNEPELETYYMYPDGTEYKLSPDTQESNSTEKGKIYNKLLIKNILAGRVPIFNFDTRMKYNLGDKLKYGSDYLVGGERNYTSGEILDEEKHTKSITHITSELIFEQGKEFKDYKLQENQMLQLVSPSLTSTTVYPVYVNYHLYLDNYIKSTAIPCKLTCLNPKNSTDNYITSGSELETLITTKLSEGISIYRKAKTSSSLVEPGYLVDKDNYKYQQVEHYTPNYLYYYKADARDTEGQNADYKYIPKDSEYKLEGNDVLYINYTDSDDTAHWLSYHADGKIKHNGIETEESKSRTMNIIRPNFDLHCSQAKVNTGKSYSKTKDKIDPGIKWNIEGLFSLDSSEQIDLREFVKTTVKDPTPCYWITNHNNTLVLKLIENDTINKKATYEYILDEGEYFFYTNSTRTNLITFGSGTKLKLTEKYQSDIPLSIKTYNIKLSEIIDTQEIADKGIGAFNDVNWQIIQFTADNYLEVQEMNILTLSEGDVVSFSLNKSAATSNLSYNWKQINDINFKQINSDYFKYNGKSLPQGNIGNLFYWEIRSLLNINLGPELKQVLKNAENNSIREKFSLYTSKLKIDGKYKDKVSKSDLQHAEKIEEEVNTISPLKEYSDCTLKSSKLIQSIGGNLVSTHRVEIDGTKIDNLYVYDYLPSSNKGTIEINNATATTEYKINAETDLMSLSFEDVSKLESYIPCLNDTYAYLTIYYSPSLTSLVKTVEDEDGNTSSKHAGAYIQLSSDSEQPLLNNIRLLNSNNTSIPVVNNTATYFLKEGLNILYTDRACKFTLNRNDDLQGQVIIKNIDLINRLLSTNNQILYTDYGFNCDLLGISKEDQVKLIEKIEKEDTKSRFLYTFKGNNDTLLDISKFNDPYVWFNYNNVANKFTLAELNITSFDNIEIAKSSMR